MRAVSNYNRLPIRETAFERVDRLVNSVYRVSSLRLSAYFTLKHKCSTYSKLKVKLPIGHHRPC